MFISQVDQLAAHDAQSVETVSSLYVMKSRPLQGVLVDPKYKSGISGGSVAGQQKEDLFPEVRKHYGVKTISALQ